MYICQTICGPDDLQPKRLAGVRHPTCLPGGPAAVRCAYGCKSPFRGAGATRTGDDFEYHRGAKFKSLRPILRQHCASGGTHIASH